MTLSRSPIVEVLMVRMEAEAEERWQRFLGKRLVEVLAEDNPGISLELLPAEEVRRLREATAWLGLLPVGVIVEAFQARSLEQGK